MDKYGYTLLLVVIRIRWVRTDFDGESANDGPGYFVSMTSHNSATTVAITQMSGTVRIFKAACPAGEILTLNGLRNR